ncbi:MAG: glycosyltransferase family 39 protein [Candidatus Gottesmanbacteria bacterium]|nr:glycosyltransferase family 39 protein [Candidatus Gottesmanbacteria bacterium]
MEKIKRRWWLIPFIIILCVAAYLRLYKISGYMTFLGDEGRDVLVVMHMIVNHKFTLLGPTASVGGFFLGPIYYYFMLPFLWAWKLNPVGPAIMVALFGIATVFLVFKVGKDFISPLAGLVAASLYALSPLVIAYSRSSWNPNLVPFFSLLLIYLLWSAAEKKRTSTLLWIGIVLGIGLQLHYLFLFLFVVTAIWLILNAKTLPIVRSVLWVLIGCIIGYCPFLAFEVRHGFPNTQSVIRFVLAGKDTGVAPGFFTTIDDVVFRLFGRLLYRLPDGALWKSLPPWQLSLWFIGTRTTIFISFVFLIVLLVYRIPTKIRLYHASQLLLIWFSTIVLLFGFYQKAIYDYYFGIMFTLPFLLMGLLFFAVWKTRYGKIPAVILWGWLMFFNWQGRPFIYPPNNQLAQARLIAQTALAQTGGKPFNFALITGSNSDHTYRYFFEIAHRTPVTLENDQVDPKRTTVTDQLIVICELSDCKPLGHPLWEIAGFGRAEITGEWDVPFVKIFRLVHYTGK